MKYTVQKKPFPIHIKLDTGMHRLGFESNNLRELSRRLALSEHLRVSSVLSHLAAADDPDHDEFTREQIEKFKKMSRRITSKLNYPVLRHILNSAGILRFPGAQFDMVRLGIGLYGVAQNNSSIQSGLLGVTTLKSSISQIKTVFAGETIGYGRKGTAAKDMKIAVVPIGYADGLNRKLGNGKGKLHVHGLPAPIIGDICMDMCMIDITGIPAGEGDEAIVFGEKYPLAEFAGDLDTIAYEALAGISRRVKRVYFHE